MPSDILIFKNNTRGNDKVIGDVHGNKSALKSVLKKLKIHDRLFIVGDLTDKGEDSIGVIELLQKKEYKKKVVVVRGNHEEFSLSTIAALEMLVRIFYMPDEDTLNDEQLKSVIETMMVAESTQAAFQIIWDRPVSSPASDDDKQWLKLINDFRGHVVKNNGGWLLDIFMKELENGHIQCHEDQNIHYDPTSKIKLIKEFFESLPYIAYINGGELPFKVVHADMPFNDEELLSRLAAGNRVLTDQEKRYAVWARQGNSAVVPMIEPQEANPSAILTLVGHTVVTQPNIAAVRNKTKTINLDSGAYFYNNFIVLNITQKKAELSASSTDYSLLRALGQINEFLPTCVPASRPTKKQRLK